MNAKARAKRDIIESHDLGLKKAAKRDSGALKAWVKVANLLGPEPNLSADDLGSQALEAYRHEFRDTDPLQVFRTTQFVEQRLELAYRTVRNLLDHTMCNRTGLARVLADPRSSAFARAVAGGPFHVVVPTLVTLGLRDHGSPILEQDAVTNNLISLLNAVDWQLLRICPICRNYFVAGRKDQGACKENGDRCLWTNRKREQRNPKYKAAHRRYLKEGIPARQLINLRASLKTSLRSFEQK